MLSNPLSSLPTKSQYFLISHSVLNREMSSRAIKGDNMDSSMRFMFLFAMIFSFGTSNARFISSSHNSVESIKTIEETVKSSSFCKLCEQFATEALSYISENENATETEILAKLESACSKVDYLKAHCITLVDYYIPLLFNQVDNLNAESFCEKIKVCTDDSTKQITTLIIEVEETENSSESNEENTVEIVSLQSSVYCSVCQEFASEALNYFSENENTTETEILAYFRSACSKVDHFKDQCDTLVENYVTLVFSQVENLSAESFCESVKLCSGETAEITTEDESLKASEEITVGVENVKSSFCSICEDIASEAIFYLSENETETKVVYRLEMVCSKLDYFESQCLSLVKSYVPLLIEEAQNLSAGEFCEKIKLCTDDISEIVNVLKDAENKMLSKKEYEMAKIKAKSSKWCSMCEEYATEAISNIAQNETQTEILSALYSSCSKLDSLEKECKVMVDYYMPKLFTQVENITPEKFCENIHFCSSTSSEEMIIEGLSKRVRKIRIASN